jgi:hypothetical protein
MEVDKEKLGQDSPRGSDIDLVDASVQHQEDPTTISKEDDQIQNPSSENGKSGTNEEDKTLVSAVEDQVMIDAHDDKATIDDVKIDGADVKVNEKSLESKSNGTDGRIEIHLEATTTLDAVGYSSPVAQNKNVWLSDVEVLQVKTRRKYVFSVTSRMGVQVKMSCYSKFSCLMCRCPRQMNGGRHRSKLHS